GPAARGPRCPRRQGFELVLQPVELEPLPQDEEPARDLDRRTTGHVGDRDDVRPVDQLALECGASREIGRDALVDELRRDLLVLYPPRVRTDLLDLRREQGER